MSNRSTDFIELNPVGPSVGAHRPMHSVVAFSDRDESNQNNNNTNPSSPSAVGASSSSSVMPGYGAGASAGGKDGSVSPRDPSSMANYEPSGARSSDLNDLMTTYYKMCIEKEIERKRKKTSRKSWKSIFSFEYLREIFPSLILIIVAIVALTASSAAQNKVQEVNSEVASANSLARSTASALKETQESINVKMKDAQNTLDQLRADIFLLTQQANITIALARAESVKVATSAAEEVIRQAQISINELMRKTKEDITEINQQARNNVSEIKQQTTNDITALNQQAQQSASTFRQQLLSLESNYNATINQGKTDLIGIGKEALSLTSQANATALQAKIIHDQASERIDTLDQKYGDAVTIYSTIRQLNDSYPYSWVLDGDVRRIQTSISSLESSRTTITGQITTLQNTLQSNVAGSVQVLYKKPSAGSATGGTWYRYDDLAPPLRVPYTGTYLVLFTCRGFSETLWWKCRSVRKSSISNSDTPLSVIMGNTGKIQSSASGFWIGSLSENDTLRLEYFVIADTPSVFFYGNDDGYSSIQIIRIGS